MTYRINALLAFWLTGLMVAFWALSAHFGWAETMIGEVRGAMILAFGLIIQYFYRKKPKEPPASTK